MSWLQLNCLLFRAALHTLFLWTSSRYKDERLTQVVSSNRVWDPSKPSHQATAPGGFPESKAAVRCIQTRISHLGSALVLQYEHKRCFHVSECLFVLLLTKYSFLPPKCCQLMAPHPHQPTLHRAQCDCIKHFPWKVQLQLQLADGFILVLTSPGMRGGLVQLACLSISPANCRLTAVGPPPRPPPAHLRSKQWLPRAILSERLRRGRHGSCRLACMSPAGSQHGLTIPRDWGVRWTSLGRA